MKKIICILLSLLFIMGISACGNKEQNSSSGEFEKTEYILAENGTTTYKIVIPEDADYYEQLASEELTEFMERATGVKYQTVEESDGVGEGNIWLGRTDKFDKSGLVADNAKLTDSGYIIKTVGKDVFICGGASLGTLYGAYEFMNREIGFEVYASDEIYTDINVKTLNLLNFDLEDIPDIEWRQTMCAPLYTNKLASGRMRLNDANDVFMYPTYYWHNSMLYLPDTVYAEAHPEWFGDGTATAGKEYTQLCYTAHGRDESLALMQDTVLGIMKDKVKENFDAGRYLKYITFMHEDYNTWCKCPECNEVIKNYDGSNAATLIRFLNPIAESLNKWIDETYPGHNVTVVTFAYTSTQQAPVRSDGNGGWQPIDDSVDLNEYVTVLYALFQADYYVPLTDTKNSNYYVTIQQWSSLTDKLAMWIYNANFSCYMLYHDSIGSMAENYKLARDYNVFYLFDQGLYNMGESVTGFNYLKMYLNSKLCWDVDEDFNALVDNFFENYYKDAAGPVREMYNMIRIFTQKQHNENGMSGIAAAPSNEDARYWDLGYLQSILLKAEEAYDAIEYLKGQDPDMYELLYDRISAERVSYEYLILKNFSHDISAAERTEMQTRFKNDCIKLGIQKTHEYGQLSDFWAGW